MDAKYFSPNSSLTVLVTFKTLFVMVYLSVTFGDVCGFCSDGIVKENTSLLSSNFSRTKTIGLYDCAARCLSHGMCQSFSFYRKEKMCSLNSENRTFTSNDLKTVEDCFFSNVVQWKPETAGLCFNRPCPRVQQCSVKRYKVVFCDQPPLGLKCTEDVNCALFGRSECSEGLCICETGFYLKGGESQCRPVIGSVCFTNTDCDFIPNAFCNRGTCTCRIGYSFDANQVHCRSTKDCNLFTSTFTSFEGDAIIDNDQETIDGLTNAECMELCLTRSDFTCKAFEYMAGITRCFLNSVAWFEVSDDVYIKDDRAIYNNRNCDW